MFVSPVRGVCPSANNKSSVSFKRALTSAENREYQALMKKAKNSLGTNESYLVCFDTSFPSKKEKNTGIGTSFSDAGQDFLKFMKKMTGITFLQDGPQGTVSKGNICPFSGAVFAIGEHLIDLEKLTQDKYNNVLPTEIFDEVANEEIATKTNFESVIGEKQTRALKTAFLNFQELDSNSSLKIKYRDFLSSQTTDWLERDALYDALSEKHQNDYWKNWGDDLDKNLFSGKYSPSETEQRINEIKSQYSDAIDFSKFVQFIANEQQKETKAELKNSDIKISGDCLIGFSPRENWAYQSAFKENTYVGCQGDEGIVQWGLPALNYDKIGYVGELGEAGQLLKHKFDLFFERYDGARLDAAWQFVSPYLYEKQEGQDVRTVDSKYMGDTIFKIMDQSAREKNITPENITYEMLGGPVDFRDGILKNRTQIHHSIYQNPGWGSVKFYKDNGLADKDFTFGLGTHDDKSLIEIAREKQQEQAPVLASNLKMFDENSLRNDKNLFMRAKWAELFTARNNFFTAFDALGLDVRFNDQKINPDNWSARIPDNYEEVYHRNLTEKKGLNTARALADAMQITNKGDYQVREKLHKIASVLEEKGPMSEKEANNSLGENFKAF